MKERKEPISQVDQIDEKIISMLKEDGRKAFVDIAKVINLSEAAVRRRVANLTRLGIISKFTIETNLGNQSRFGEAQLSHVRTLLKAQAYQRDRFDIRNHWRIRHCSHTFRFEHRRDKQDNRRNQKVRRCPGYEYRHDPQNCSLIPSSQRLNSQFFCN